MLVRLVPVFVDPFCMLARALGLGLWLHVVNPVKLNQLMAAIMLIVSSGCKL